MGRIPIFVVAVYIIFNMAAKKQTNLSFFMKGDKTSASDKKRKDVEEKKANTKADLESKRKRGF